jgi:hypothetical protein
MLRKSLARAVSVLFAVSVAAVVGLSSPAFAAFAASTTPASTDSANSVCSDLKASLKAVARSILTDRKKLSADKFAYHMAMSEGLPTVARQLRDIVDRDKNILANEIARQEALNLAARAANCK